MQFTIAAATAILAASMVSAHCKIPIAKGNAGGKSTAFGIEANSGDGKQDVPFLGTTGFGNTTDQNPINPNTALPAALKIAGSNQVPQVTEGGQLFMTLHQVNADGAGPFACSLNTDGTAKSFKQVTVTKNVDGDNGISNVTNTNFPLTAKIPNNVRCTGKIAGVANLCLLKCENPVGFGGMVPIQVKAAAAGAAANRQQQQQRGKGKNKNGAKKQNKNQHGNKHQRDAEDVEASEIAGRAAGVREVLRRSL